MESGGRRRGAPAGIFEIDELLRLAPQEERVYRLRCVEPWSAVVPWVGCALSERIRRAEPTGSPKYVEFTTLADPKQMPGLVTLVLDRPYIEGLRMDEAMHPLTSLAFGLYGEMLPAQIGAPLRLADAAAADVRLVRSLLRAAALRRVPLARPMVRPPCDRERRTQAPASHCGLHAPVVAGAAGSDIDERMGQAARRAQLAAPAPACTLSRCWRCCTSGGRRRRRTKWASRSSTPS